MTADRILIWRQTVAAKIKIRRTINPATGSSRILANDIITYSRARLAAVNPAAPASRRIVTDGIIPNYRVGIPATMNPTSISKTSFRDISADSIITYCWAGCPAVNAATAKPPIRQSATADDTAAPPRAGFATVNPADVRITRITANGIVVYIGARMIAVDSSTTTIRPISAGLSMF